MNNMYNQQNYTGQKAPWFTTYLVLSILELLCCNMVTGIIALVFAIMSSSAYQIGQYIDAENKRKAAKLSLIIGLIIGVVLYVAVIIFYIFLGAVAYKIGY